MQQVVDRPSPPRWQAQGVRWTSLDILWIALLPATLLIALNTRTIEPNDYWWHVRTGQIIITEHRIPVVDEFSFSQAGTPWMNQAWLMQSALFILHRSGGLPLVLMTHALVITLGYALVLRSSIRSSGLKAGVIASYVGAAVAFRSWGVRPQSISFLWFGALIALIESHRKNKGRQIWWAVPLFVLWGNSHGGFVFGLAVLGLYICGQLWTLWSNRSIASRATKAFELIALGGASIVALSLNPQGFLGNIVYIAGFLKSDATLRGNLEFAPITVRTPAGALFFASLLIFAAALSTSKKRPEADQVAGVLIFAFFTLFSRRSAPWYGLVLIPPLASLMQPLIPTHRPEKQKPLLNGTLLIFLGIGVVLSTPWLRNAFPWLAERKPIVSHMTPIRATAFLCSHIPAEGARIYQHQAFGSYQEWACPTHPVFIDTRIELYPQEQWEDYLVINNARYDWEKITQRYGFTHLFLSVSDQQTAISAVRSSPRWREIYSDERAVLFERTDAPKNSREQGDPRS